MEKGVTLTSISLEKIALKYRYTGIGYIKSCNHSKKKKNRSTVVNVTGTIMTYDL